MATTTIEVKDLPGRLAEMVAAAAAGNEVILVENHVPRARLVPLALGGLRIPGLHPGAFAPGPDFDDPLPDEFWLSGNP